MEAKRTFYFNTAITDVDAEGKWSEDKHKEQVLILRPLIMRHDGMTGCFIGRYYIEVNYLDSVTSETRVKQIVREMVMQAAATPGLFPLRGNKVPRATLRNASRKRRDPNENQTVYVDFSSHVLTFTPSMTDESWDNEAFRLATHPLAKALTAHDGIVGFKLRFSSASLTFDPRYTTSDAVAQHMTDVFNRAAAEGFAPTHPLQEMPTYFPYISSDKPLELSFRDK